MKRLFKNLFGSKSNDISSRKATYRPQLDTLEERRVLSTVSTYALAPAPGTISFDANTGVVSIQGTDGRDSARIEYNYTSVGTRVKIDLITNFNTSSEQQQIKLFDVAAVKKIDFVGRAGDDSFNNGTAVPSHADGGAGADTLIGGRGRDVLEGGLGSDYIRGMDGNDELYAFSATESETTDVSPDMIYGGTGADKIVGSIGNDWLFGEENDDVISGLAGDDYISGGDGNDIIGGDVGNDIINGDAGDDKLYGGGENPIYGGQNNIIYGGDGNDLIVGAAGDDQLFGDNGDDEIYGKGGNDRIYGGNDNDTLIGGEGKDELNGQRGDDVLDGNERLSAYIDVLKGITTLDINRDNQPDAIVGGGGKDTFVMCYWLTRRGQRHYEDTFNKYEAYNVAWDAIEVAPPRPGSAYLTQSPALTQQTLPTLSFTTASRNAELDYAAKYTALARAEAAFNDANASTIRLQTRLARKEELTAKLPELASLLHQARTALIDNQDPTLTTRLQEVAKSAKLAYDAARKELKFVKLDVKRLSRLVHRDAERLAKASAALTMARSAFGAAAQLRSDAGLKLSSLLEQATISLSPER